MKKKFINQHDAFILYIINRTHFLFTKIKKKISDWSAL